jgi:hypothetical protein
MGYTGSPFVLNCEVFVSLSYDDILFHSLYIYVFGVSVFDIQCYC